MQTPISFFEYVNGFLMAGYSRHTLDGWMRFSFSDLLGLFLPRARLCPSSLLILRPLSHRFPDCEVCSSQPSAMIGVIGLKMESSLSLCHQTKGQFVFNECFHRG